MVLFEIPVVMPYRLRDDPDGTFCAVQVNTVASTEAAAVSSAQALVHNLAGLKHRGHVVETLPERIRVGSIGRPIEGPYAYVLTHGRLIDRIDFPARIDNHCGEAMGDAFAGLDPTVLLGVVMDCNPLTYINTSGLASIAAHAERIHLRLFRVSDAVRRVFQIVGLVQLLRIFPDLRSALEDLVVPQAAMPVRTP